MKMMDRNYAIALGGGDFLQIVDGLKVVRTELDVRTGALTLVRTGTYSTDTIALGPAAQAVVARIRQRLIDASFAKFSNRGGHLFAEEDAEIAPMMIEVASNGSAVVRMVSGNPAPAAEVDARLAVMITLLGELDVAAEVHRITECDRFLCQAVDELFTTVDEESADAGTA